jgi:Family of unknown function (DUF5670)
MTNDLHLRNELQRENLDLQTSGLSDGHDWYSQGPLLHPPTSCLCAVDGWLAFAVALFPAREETVYRYSIDEQRRSQMLWTIAVVLIILWLLGLVTSYTMGGFIHILIVIAIVVVLIRVIQGRKVL